MAVSAPAAAGAARRRVTVLCLGDIGRSPRMQYHSLSLADDAGLEVDLIGYAGATAHRQVLNHPHIHLHHLPQWTARGPRGLSLLLLPIKVIFQVLVLLWALMRVPKPNFILVQNPPAIPSLLIARAVSSWRGAKLIFDWHNYGYTILGLSIGNTHPLTRIARWYERWIGRTADAHLCVTAAMRDDLARSWNIRNAVVLHDRPPDIFQAPTAIASVTNNSAAAAPVNDAVRRKHELWVRLTAAGTFGSLDWIVPSNNSGAAAASATATSDQKSPARDSKSDDSGGVDRTLFTEYDHASGRFRMRADRPALIISSTSWTADENFDLLLDAAVEADKHARQNIAAFPRLLYIITGRGPMRQHYERRIAELTRTDQLQRTRIITVWLAAEDYPLLLAAADLGVCLHVSSSGLDLPMKVVDMFGSGLPVCAVHFKCLSELVIDGSNGKIFSDSKQLTEQLIALLADCRSSDEPPAAGSNSNSKSKPTALERLRTGVNAWTATGRWTPNWRTHALPLFQ